MREEEAFLTAYKALEEVLTVQGKTVFDFEQELSQTDMKRMQLCRLTRNFLQHENEKFILPSKEMTVFIKRMTEHALRSVEKARDQMKRVSPVLSSEKMKDAANKLDKYPVLPVVSEDKTFLGLLTDESIRKAVISNTLSKKISLQKENITFCNKKVFIRPDTLLQDLSEPFYIVTDDGTENGKYKGILFLEEKIRHE